jgi:hypothetical protein
MLFLHRLISLVYYNSEFSEFMIHLHTLFKFMQPCVLAHSPLPPQFQSEFSKWIGSAVSLGRHRQTLERSETNNSWLYFFYHRYYREEENRRFASRKIGKKNKVLYNFCFPTFSILSSQRLFSLRGGGWKILWGGANKWSSAVVHFLIKFFSQKLLKWIRIGNNVLDVWKEEFCLVLYIWSRDERLLELSTSSPVVFVWEKDGKPLIRDMYIFGPFRHTACVWWRTNVKTEVELVVGLLSKTFAKQPTIHVSCNSIECPDGKSRVWSRCLISLPVTFTRNAFSRWWVCVLIKVLNLFHMHFLYPSISMGF